MKADTPKYAVRSFIDERLMSNRRWSTMGATYIAMA